MFDVGELAVMIRLVFLLSAEEQELLLLGDEIYDRHYAVSTLAAKLREEADRWQWKIPGESWLYRRWREMPAIVKAVRESGWKDYESRYAPYVPRDYADMEYSFAEEIKELKNFNI